MSAPAHIARENGKKGGRPKAAHTIQAEAGKAALIAAYLKNIKPINDALIKKAKRGDIQAISAGGAKEAFHKMRRSLAPFSGLES